MADKKDKATVAYVKAKGGPWDGTQFRFDISVRDKPVDLPKKFATDGGSYHLFNRNGGRWFQWVPTATT